MCEPTTIAIMASVASAAVGAYSSIQQGRAAYAAGQVNAQIAERNVQAAENEQKNVGDAAAIERRRLGERVRAERGMNKVSAAASGIDPLFGTPFDIDADLLKAGRADAAIIARNEMLERGRLDYQIADYRDSASQSRAQGRGALRAGYLEAAGNVLQASSSIAGQWIQPGANAPKKPTTKPPSIFDRQKLPIGAGGY